MTGLERAWRRAAKRDGLDYDAWITALVEHRQDEQYSDGRCVLCRRRYRGYMVHAALWAVCGLGTAELCLPCLEHRMGRRVDVCDLLLCPLTLEHPRCRRMVERALAGCWPPPRRVSQATRASARAGLRR